MKKTETTALCTNHGQQNIPVSALAPHPDACIPIEECDRISIQSSIEKNLQGVLLPLLVSHLPDPKTGCHLIYDGVNRWKGAVALGIDKLTCILTETSDPKRLISELLLAGRKKTNGTKVMSFLMAHEKEVMDARKIHGDGHENLKKGQCFPVSHGETPWNEDFTIKGIAGRLGCIREDVTRGIQLLESIANKQMVDSKKPANAKYVENLKAIRDRVITGALPIRTCLAAAGGAKHKGEARGKTDWGMSAINALKSLINGLEHYKQFQDEDLSKIANLWPKLEKAKANAIEE